jgi:hypothetical protein
MEGEIMKKTIIPIAAAILMLGVGEARAGFEAGESVGSILVGAGRIGGHDTGRYKTGFLTSGELLYYHSPAFAYGAEVSYHAPETKSKFVSATTREDLRSRFISLLPTARVNLMPSGKTTPYLAAGVGVAQHQTRLTAGASESKFDYWRLTGVVRLGWDCVHEKWIAGVDARYQYLDSLTQNYGLGVRLGWRY